MSCIITFTLYYFIVLLVLLIPLGLPMLLLIHQEVFYHSLFWVDHPISIGLIQNKIQTYQLLGKKRVYFLDVIRKLCTITERESQKVRSTIFN